MTSVLMAPTVTQRGPCPHCQRPWPGLVTIAEFTLPGHPASMNTNAGRSHWRNTHPGKKDWQLRFAYQLNAMDLPRPLPVNDGEPLDVEVIVTVPTRHRRDDDNLRTWTIKSLGDALAEGYWEEVSKKPYRRRQIINGGWIPDDQVKYWRPTFRLAYQRGVTATTVRLQWAPPTESVSEAA